MGQVGLLWQVTHKDFETGVLEGLNHFRKEYGSEPDEIELNPFHINETFKGKKTLDGVTLVEGKQVFKNQAVYALGDSIEDLIEKRKNKRENNNVF